MKIPVSPNWLANRVLILVQMTSFKVLHDKGHINANGYMKNDERVTPWKEAVKENNIALLDESPLTQYIQEELNLAYAVMR